MLKNKNMNYSKELSDACEDFKKHAIKEKIKWDKKKIVLHGFFWLPDYIKLGVDKIKLSRLEKNYSKSKCGK